MKTAIKQWRIVRRRSPRNKLPRSPKHLWLGVLLVLISLGVFYTRAGAPTRVYASPANTLNFQARLLNSTGSIVADGTYSVQFKLYSASSGGTAEWTETQGSVTVKSGYLSVYLGSVTSFPGTIDWSQQQWLTMNINSDGEMSPRLQMTSVPAAFHANESDALRSGSNLLTADNFAQLGPSSPQVVNLAIAALRLNQTGAGGLIQFQHNGNDVFTVANNGDLVSSGSGMFSGGTLTLGSATQSGGLVLNDGAGKKVTIQSATLGVDRTLTAPDESGTICVQNSTSCGFVLSGGAAGAFVNNGNSFGVNAILGTNDNFTLSFRTNNTNQITLDTSGNFNLLNGGLQIAGSTVLTSSKVLQNLTGIASSGNIDLSSLSAGGIIKAASGTGRLLVATAGTDYENPLTFNNGLTRSTNTIQLGGALTQATTIDANSLYSITVNSTLTGARSTYPFVISQANNATNDNSTGLLQLSNADTGSTAALLNITQVTNGTGLQISGITSGTGVNANSVTTGTAFSATGITSGSGLTVTGPTTGNGLLVNMTANNASTAKGLSITGAAAGITADYTGAFINVNPTRTLTAAATRTDSGNFLNLTRSNTVNNAGATYNVTGALANLQSNCTQTAGTCADSANILSLNQQYASSTGTILNIIGAGAGNLAVFDASNASANGVSIDVQSSSSSQYVFKATSNNGSTNDLYVRADGNVGIGTASPANALHILSNTNGGRGLRIENTNGGGAAYATAEFKSTGHQYAVGIGGSSESLFGLADKFFIFDNNAVLPRLVVDTNGNVGIGATSPSALLSVGSSSQFQVNGSGAVTAVGVNAGTGSIQGTGGLAITGNSTITGTLSSLTGLSSSGTITFGSLSAGGVVKADTSGNLSVATAGTDYENPLTFNNGLTRSANTVKFGGQLTALTDLDFNSNNLTFSGSGFFGLGSTSAAYKLDLRTPSVQTSQIHVASTNTDAGGYLLSVADNQFLGSGGASFNGTNWVAKATTATIYGASVGGSFIVQADSGLTAGNTYTPTTRFTVANSGAVTIAGTLAVNGGTLSSSSSAFTLLSVPTTVTAFGAATTLSLGTASGTTTINGNTLTSTALTFGGSGATTIQAASGQNLTVQSQGSGGLTLTSGSGTISLGSGTLQRSASSLNLDVANGSSDSTLTITNSGSGVANLSVEGGITAGTNSAFSVNVNGDVTAVSQLLDGSSTANGSSGLGSSTSLTLTSAANFDVGNYVQVSSSNCGGAGINPCYAKITNKATNTLTITPALTWANASAVKEYHIPEVGGVDTSQALANRYGRGYFIAGVATGNGTTYYNEDSIVTSLANYDLLSGVTGTLSVGVGANQITLGGSSTTTTFAGTVNFTGTVSGIGPNSGTSGYLQRSGTTISPATTGDSFTTSGNISTSGSGTITSAGALTIQGGGANITGGLTLATGALNLTSGGITNAGSIAGATTIAASGAITAAISGNTINGLIINSGALSGISTINGSGLITSVGLNAGTGLIQNTGGLTSTGSINLNASASTNTTNIGTGTTSGQITIGGGSAPLVIDSTNFDVSSAGALSGITTIGLSGAITGATSTNTINGLVINSGSLSAITGFSQTSGNFAISGSGTFGTGTGAISLNGATTVTGTNTFTVSGGLASLGAGLSVTGDANISLHSYVPATVFGNTAAQGYFTGSSGTKLGGLQSLDYVGNTYTFFGNNKYFDGTNWQDNGLGRVGASFQIQNDNFTFYSFDTAANFTARFSVASGGNVAIGLSGAPGALLSVGGSTGNFQVSSSGAVTSVGETSAGAAVSFNNNSNFNTSINAGTSTGTITLGGGSAPLVIDSTHFDVSSAGAISGITTINASGLATISGGATISGAAINLNDTSNFATNINTGTSSGTVTIGGGSAPLVINSTAFDVSSAGALSGITTINASGLATISGGATISGAAISLNASSNFTVSIGTGTSTGAISIGGGSNTFSLNSTTIDISTAGAITGITGLTDANGNTGSTIAACTAGQYIGNGVRVDDGLITAGSCRNDAGISDQRVKKNIVPLEDGALDKIKQVNTVSFDFRCDDPQFAAEGLDCTSGRQTGVIAQQLAQILPDLVYQDELGYYNVKYTGLSMYTLKAVSELSDKVDNLSSGGASTDSGVSTGGTLRLDKNGILENINGLNMLGGGATVAGGLNNTGGGITNTGAISGATSIGAESLALNANSSDNLLTLIKDGKGVFSVFNNGALEMRLDANNTFAVKKADGSDVFSINTSGGLVQVGGTTADDKAILLVLDSKNTTGDPAGVNGAQYYNAADNKFRCFQDNKWQDCLSATYSEDILSSQPQSWMQPDTEQEFPGQPRTWIDLTSTQKFRVVASIIHTGVSDTKCRLQYAMADNGPWSDLSASTDDSLSLGTGGTLKSNWFDVVPDARKEVLIRIMCKDTNHVTNNSVSTVRVQLR